MQCSGIFLFPRTFEVVSMDLVSMAVNNEEPMEIILITTVIRKNPSLET